MCACGWACHKRHTCQSVRADVLRQNDDILLVMIHHLRFFTHSFRLRFRLNGGLKAADNKQSENMCRKNLLTVEMKKKPYASFTFTQDYTCKETFHFRKSKRTRVTFPADTRWDKSSRREGKKRSETCSKWFAENAQVIKFHLLLCTKRFFAQLLTAQLSSLWAWTHFTWIQIIQVLEFAGSPWKIRRKHSARVGGIFNQLAVLSPTCVCCSIKKCQQEAVTLRYTSTSEHTHLIKFTMECGRLH